MPKSESGVSAAWEQKDPKHNVKHFETKIEWLHKGLLIQPFLQILTKIICFAFERKQLIAKFQFRCWMLVVIPVFTHQTIKLGRESWLADITEMQVYEGQRFQGGHLVTMMASATSLPTVAVSLCHTKDSGSLVSAGPSFLLLSDWQSWVVHLVLLK